MEKSQCEFVCFFTLLGKQHISTGSAAPGWARIALEKGDNRRLIIYFHLILICFFAVCVCRADNWLTDSDEEDPEFDGLTDWGKVIYYPDIC